jgi:Carboxypeptidase regulatory-like domain/TonB-dependent Receptor Plug Domain
MTRSAPPLLRASCAVLLTLLCAAGAFAQTGLQTGNIFGTVEANDGSVLPGVTVTLTGVGAPQTQVTDAQGRFRFVNLSPATYTLKAELAGYGTATRAGINVNIGRNAEVTIQLNPSVSDVITVTAEAPLLDQRRTGTGATLTEVELEQVPSARDPWVILQQVPGVLMDRINVGGNESGQQSGFVSKGVGSDQATYSVDGVNTTDMIATGGSSAYYDFGSFEEIQVATGGTDPRVQSPGAQINMVTKRGTNDLTGSARYYMADGEWQADATPPAEAVGYLRRANEIDTNNEWGFDIGGPIIRDRLWLWGAYADQQVDLLVAWPTRAELEASGLPASDLRFTDKTSLETINAKLNAQVTRNNSAVLFYYDNQKEKQGRNASPTRPPETTWNQAGFGPAGTYKLEDTHIFNSNFYLTGLYSKVNGGFGLWANSGANCQDMDCVRQNASNGSWVIDLASLTNRNTFVSVQGERPQEQVRLDGSAFFNTGSLSHELKFGFGYRNAGAEGLTVYPNDQLILDYTNLGYPQLGLTYFYAIGPYDYEYKYNDIYVGDTMLWGNLTVQAGLRFDNQKGIAGDQTGPAHPLIPEYLPAVSVSADDIEEMEWNTVSPRLGLTYALGAEKRTLLRAAYNRYVGQLGSNSSGFTGTVPAYYRYIAFYTFDANSNDIITQDEILFEYGIYGRPVGFDPENPTDTRMRRIDADIEAPTTDEYILGFEHELFRDFVVSLNYTHRDLDNFIWTQFEKTRGAGDFITRADYIPTRGIYPGTGNPTITNLCNQDRDDTTPDTNCTPEVDPYSITVYSLRPGVEPKYGVLRNRPGYSQTYDGLELGLVKRMSNRWMLRGNFSWNDWVQNVDEDSIIDPTPLRTAFGCSVCDGADVVQGSGTISGAKGAVWINSEWSLNVAGVYQIPVLETNFGMNFTMRQGYPILYAHPVYVTEDVLGSPNAFIARNVLVSDVTEHRLPNPYSLDLRLAKDFRFRGVGLELSVDAFNVTNNRPELQRNADLRSRSNQRRARTADFIRELQSPRIFRVGARLTF